MQKRYPVCISLEEKTISKIDRLRGLVPRSRFIESRIIEELKNG